MKKTSYFCKMGKMESPGGVVLILALVTFAPAPGYSLKIEASMDILPVGSTVTLSSDTVVTTGAWLDENGMIVLITSTQTFMTDFWESRATYNKTSSSLTITSLFVEQSGKYTLQDMNSSTSADLTLHILEPVSGVTLQANETNLVEFNDTVVLSCSVSNGSSLLYTWMKNDSEVTAGERVQFSDDGATLIISNVTRDDNGMFKCNVSNLYNFEVSSSVSLNVSYGPSNVKMMITPAGYNHKTESDITLSCSAESKPEASIQWMLDGKYLDVFGPKLHLNMSKENNSGEYKCLFHNPVTSRFSSTSAMIRIIEPLEAAMVKNTGGPAILDEMLTLQCEVDRPVTMIKWMKDSKHISANSSVMFDASNMTLTLNPVKLSDAGEYQCEASNEVSSVTSNSYLVEVNYGPMKPDITGPSFALKGEKVLLNCSADSHPPSFFRWYFNDTLLANTSTLVVGQEAMNMSGNYKCMAFNSITGKNSSAHAMLTIFDPITKVSVKDDGAQPILNHTYALTCETTGSVQWIMWTHNMSPLSANDRITLSMDNTTLTFNPLMDSDKGSYQCEAFNPLSNWTSENFMLDVLFGPEMPNIIGPGAATLEERVKFICDARSNPPSTYLWFFNNSVKGNTSEYITPPLTYNMSGTYTCVAFNNITGKNSTADKVLDVIDPAMKATVEKPMYPPIEGHDYKLTCNVTGPVKYIHWMKNGEPLHEDNTTTLGSGNMTVNFSPINYNDTGKYQCMAFNAIMNTTSPPHKLYVNFGPKMPQIRGPSYGETGQRVHLKCSAKSLPPSHYSWWHNGSEVANTPVFMTSPLTMNMSGVYTCVAHNNVTEKNSSSSHMLTVIEAIKSVMLTNKTLPLQSQNFTLTCEVVGPFDSLHWMKDNKPLNMMTPNTGMSYSIEGEKLHFTPVTRSNDGLYHCVATNNATSHHSNPYTLLVNYGPLSVTIIAPDTFPIGLSVLMKCFADSNPECEFRWFYKDLSAPLLDGSVLSFPVTNESDGTYICRARNPVTNITMYQTKVFTAHAVGLHSQSKAALTMMGLLVLAANVLFS